jgi:predicted MFS family arabinose efflux permease
VRQRWAILALLMAAQTTANVGPLGIPALAPLIREDLGLSVAQAGSFLSAYYVGPVLISLPAGWMGDRWGVLRSMVAGQAVIALGLTLAAQAGRFDLLLGLMVAAGAGYGMLNPTTAKAAIAWFPRRQRATAVGLKQVGLPLGGALGALALPPLALALGWRTAVIASAAALAIVALLTWLLYRDPPAPEPLAAAPAGGHLRGVLLSRDLWLVSLATLVFAGVQTVLMAFLVLYLRDVVRLPLLEAARYLVLAQATGIAGRVVFGLVSDRLFGGRRRLVLGIAGLGSAASAVAVAAVGPDSGPALLVPLALGFGFFGIGWNGVQHTLMAELAGPRAAGTALGLGLAISSLGVTVCPPLFGLLVEWSGSFRGAWIALGAVMALALGLLVPVRERRLEGP